MMLFIFDMGGVLARDFDIAPDAARLLGMDVSELRAAWEPLMMPFMRGELCAAEGWERFEKSTGRRASEDYWQTLFRPKVDDEVLALIRGLGASERVVCGSNTIDSHYRILRERGFYDCFHAVYVSNLLGRAKPEPGFWLSILEAEGIEAKDAVFIDDMEENVRAAAALGMEAIHFIGAAMLADRLKAYLR